MGNSGVALSDPMAASIYNPSLLIKKTKDTYSLSGNTIGRYSSKTSSSELTSFALNPGYLSTVMVGDSLVHEFFMANSAPTELKVESQTTTSSEIKNMSETTRQSQFLFGYSMAFKSFPFALSYFGQYFQKESTSFLESTSVNTNQRSVTQGKSDLKSLGLGLSISSHSTFSGYTLGYHLRTRQIKIYRKDDLVTKNYLHGGTSATDYTITEVNQQNVTTQPNGFELKIGHGFQVGDHEFLTDSQLEESAELSSTYRLRQTFGYRLNTKSGHQFLCGLSHDLGQDVKYFGQSAFYSVGYSWKTNSLRSVLGGYVYRSNLSQDVFAVGLTFGSEFYY